jgi:predicted AlkP superfamily pyrophosphatase or phosphodiesterase
MILQDGFIKPRYDSTGFASLPGRVRTAYASGEYDAVVLLLADGFGWRFAERFQDAPFLQRLSRMGGIEKLTSQFPSTTAAHLTTLHTGFPVGESGVFEWFYYEPLLDRIIAPLLFSFAGDRNRDTLKASGIDPRRLLPSTTLYEALAQDGVRSHVFSLRDYTPSTYSTVVMRGAELHSFKTLPEALVNAGKVLEDRSGPTYIHMYFDRLDALCHEYGPSAPQTEAEIEAFLLIMDQFFTRAFGGKGRVLFLMTADHGATEVDPQTTVFLNVDERFAGIERFLKRNRAGTLLVPAGSARDMFLYVKDELLEEAIPFLSERLQDRGEVVRVSDLMDAGYFGPTLSEEFRARAGNLVILMHRGQAVWWYVKDKFEQRFYGHHGGLTPEELEIPLFSCSLE